MGTHNGMSYLDASTSLLRELLTAGHLVWVASLWKAGRQKSSEFVEHLDWDMSGVPPDEELGSVPTNSNIDTTVENLS